MAHVAGDGPPDCRGCAAHPPPTDDARSRNSHAERDPGRGPRPDLRARPSWNRGCGASRSGRSTTGAVLYELNSRKLMMPASNMKIVTLAAAAETLGWDYRFKTTLETAAPVEDGALEGDLIVRGGGDPTINARDRRAAAVFDEWADALKAAGITRIDGRIVGDDSAFDDATLGGGWAWDYLQDGYAAPVGALEFNENIATLTVRPGRERATAAFVEAVTWRRPAAASPRGHRPRRVARRRSTSSAGRTARRWTSPVRWPSTPSRSTRDVAVVNPTVFFAHALSRSRWSRAASRSAAPQSTPTTCWTRRPRSRRVLARIAIAAASRDRDDDDEGQPESLRGDAAEGGRRGERRARAPPTADASRPGSCSPSWGIQPGSYVQIDGSGLSRYDYVTADMIVTLLERVYRRTRATTTRSSPRCRSPARTGRSRRG